MRIYEVEKSPSSNHSEVSRIKEARDAKTPIVV